MKKKLLLLLVVLILGYSVNVYADMDMEQKSIGTSVSGNEFPDTEVESDVESAENSESETTKEEEETTERVAQDDAEIMSNGAQEKLLEEETEYETKADILYSVSFPADINAYLDPGNLSGRGQVFSSHFAVENYGNTNVAIKIKNIDVYYSSAENIYELSDSEVTDNTSHVKKLNINMVWENKSLQTEKVLHISEGVQDEIVLLLGSAEYDEDGSFIHISDNGVGSFYFTGTVNANPNLVWEDGEVAVKFDYEIINVEKVNAEEKDWIE